MLKPQRESYNMFLTVQNHFNLRPEAWNTNVPVTAAKNELSTLLESILEQLSIQMTNNTGVADDKKKLRVHVQAQAYIISSAASVYALRTRQFDFYEKIHFTKSYFKLLRDAELQSACTNLATDVSTKIASLLPYGITPELVTTFSADIANFIEVMKSPKDMVRKKANATKTIADLIKTTSTLLTTQMDPLMVVLKISQPKFVSAYNNLRLLKKLGKTKLKLSTKVIDEATEKPIEGAVLRILKTKVKRTSSARGINIVKNLAEGAYELRVSHDNYKVVIIKFKVMSGETTKLVIALKATEPSTNNDAFIGE